MTAPAAVAAAAPPRRLTAARALLGALVLLMLVHLYRKARGVTFYYDEWNFVLERRPWNVASLLEPHNEHLSLVPVLVYKVIMSTSGIANHDPYLVVLLLLHGLCAGLLFAIVRRRLDDWMALCAAVLLLFLGTAWIDIIWAFQIGFLASIASGLGLVLALEREDRRGDVVAGVLLAVAIASSSIGIPILAGVIVHLVARPDRTKRWPVWAVPLALYAVWYLIYGKGSVKRENLTDVPPYVTDMISAGMAGLVNQPLEIGRILFCIGAYVLVTRTARAARVPPALLGLIAAALAFWSLTALARAQLGEATTGRYIYPSAVVLLLIAAEAARGLRPGRVALMAAGLVTAAAALSGLGRFHDGAVDLKGRSAAIRVSLGAVDIAGAGMPRDFVPEGDHAPQVAVGPYLDAVRAYGSSPALTGEELRAAGPVDRAKLEGVLIRGLGGTLLDEPAQPAGSAPAAAPTQDGTVEAEGPCLTFTPSRPGGQVAIALPERGVRVASRGSRPTKVALQRFADAPSPIGEVPGKAARLVRMRKDEAPEPWRAIIAGDEPAEICAL